MQVLLGKKDETFKAEAESFIKEYFKNTNEINLRDLWIKLHKNSLITNNNSFLKNILLTEVLCKKEPGIGLFLLTQFACMEIIKNFASPELKNKYLDKLISGEYIACFSLTEPSAGSDVTMIETTCTKQDKKWILNGHKIWASNASISDIIITFAQAKAHKDKNGITGFIIPSNSKEIEILRDTPKLGVKTTPSNEVKIKNLIVDESNQIGNLGDGIKIALNAITTGRIFCTAQAVGLLDGIIDASVKHSTKRNQFGKSISEYQAIQWYIADMVKDLDASRLLLYKAVWAKDNNPSELTKLSSMAKYFSTSSAQKHSTHAVQILGGSGLNDTSYVASCYRDSKVLEIYEGTNEIQKLIIAKELF